jgi:pimeloyl-ACP methyl ester carboxylesterase
MVSVQTKEERVVTSKDGTRIAFERIGTGPAVMMVSGATADRRWNSPLAEVMAAEFTVLNYDRRGRGASGDTLPFALEREFEDIEALIADAGGRAHLYGISSGGALALEAAAAGVAVDRLAVYEVPYDTSDEAPRVQAEYIRALETAADAGPGAQMDVFMRTVAGADDDALRATHESAEWPRLVAVEHTLRYDAASMGTGQPPADRLARITAPTLVLTGAPEGKHEVGSAEFFEAAARAIVASVANAEHRRVPGQTHMVDPAVLAPILTDFYRGA